MYSQITAPSISPETIDASTPRTRCVVLTGASSGIGRATALALAKAGFDLVLAARRRETLEMVACECEAVGAAVVVVPTDVASAQAVQALAQAALARFGAIDVWINNAGAGAVGLFDETPMEAHRQVIETNVFGHMHGAYAVLPHFKQRGRGTLINVISLAGWIPAPYATAYSTSKFALRGFFGALRSELSGHRDIHVCDVFPSFVDTPAMSHAANYSGHRLRPPPPLADPRAVADALVRLTRQPSARTHIGAPAIPGIVAHALAPHLLTRSMMWAMERAMDRSGPAAITSGNLFDASRGTSIDGGFKQKRAKPKTWVLGAGAALLASVILGSVMKRSRHRT